MAPAARTEPVRVCLDSDVLIAGLFSTSGASHALLVLGEIGLLSVVVPATAIEEVRRNLKDKLPEALPAFERFLEAPFVVVVRPRETDLGAARRLAHAKDVPILAAAMGSGASFLVTHNVRHFRSTSSVRVVRPRALVEEARAWMAKFGGPSPPA